MILALGTANFGNAYNGHAVSRREAERILDACGDLGVHNIDTAHSYGSSQSYISAYLNNQPELFRVFSKFMHKSWRRDLTKSVMQFGPHMHCAMWHDFSFNKMDSSMKGLAEHPAGDLHLGASTYGISEAIEACVTGAFGYLEIEFNMCFPHVYRHVRNHAENRKCMLLCRSVFQRGFLTDSQYKARKKVHHDPLINKQMWEVADAFKRMADDMDMTLEELALKFAASYLRDDDILILGVNNYKQLETNVYTLKEDPMHESIVTRIEEIALNMKEPWAWDLRRW